MHDDDEDAALRKILTLIFLTAGLIGLMMLGCMGLSRAQQGPQPATYYRQNGPQQVRIYDGGTQARNAYDARRNLGVPSKDGLDSLAGNWRMTGSLTLPWTYATDTSWVLRDDVDTTKKVKFLLDGISTGMTRMLRFQDRSGWLISSPTGGPSESSIPYGDFYLYDVGHTTSLTGFNSQSGNNGSLFVINGNTPGTTHQIGWPLNRDGDLALTSDTWTGSSLYDPLLRVKDTQFFVKNASDTTKKAQLTLANQTTGTTTVDSLPVGSQMLAGLGTANVFRTTQTISTATDVVPLYVSDPSGSHASNFIEFVSAGSAVAALDNGGVYTCPGINIGVPGSNYLNIQNKSSISASRNYTIDNSIASTDFMMTGGTQSVSGAKTFSGSSVLRTATASGVAFSDPATTTKTMRFDLTGITAATQRTMTVPDANGTWVITQYKADSTSRVANMASYNMLASPAAGRYEVSIYAVVTAVMGGTLTLTAGWTDPKQAQTATATLAAAAGSYQTIQLPIQVASGAITFATSGYSSGTYSVYLSVRGPL